jgi:1,4-alpha-glucan branching enzyme
MAWLICLTMVSALFAQFDPSKVCRIADGRLVITLDNRWTKQQLKEVGSLYALDSLLLADAISGRHVINDSGIIWLTSRIDKYRIELSKEQEEVNARDAGDLIFLLDDNLVKKVVDTERESTPYGVNRMTRNNIIPIRSDQYRFFLPGFQSARNVYLAGSFNGWSTMENPMIRVDSGWITALSLLPGKYSYKYIIDGKWIHDPFNRYTENDLHGGMNSIWFAYNYQFSLGGFSNARAVHLAGSFNQWRQKELKMIRINGKWRINMYLREGTHAYKFLVDNQWITDPANKVTRPDGMGNVNSFMSLGDTLYFSLRGFPKASKVVVTGNFNVWNREELQMQKVDGGWELPYVLAAGVYEYKFIVDGRWIIDPDNPNTTGSGDFTNSILTVKPNYTFRLEKFPNAGEVYVTGNFNGWSRSGYRMVKRNGAWVFPIRLAPGKYLYKFIVDGRWIIDPGNELWEENEYGTSNSVLWVNP